MSKAIEIVIIKIEEGMMGFPIPLGREAVHNKFLVDPDKFYLQSDRKDCHNRACHQLNKIRGLL